MAIPDKDQGQSISIDDIEDEFLNEDDGLGQDTPISFGSFRGELGTLFGTPLSFSQFSGKSVDPDLQPITATGGRITSDFNGLRQYTLGDSGTLTAYKVSQSYGEVSKGLTVTWRQTVGKLSANLNIDNETGESITFSAPFALNNTAVTVRATVVDWQGDTSTEDFTFVIRGYQVPDPPALEDNTVDGAPNGTKGVLSQYNLDSGLLANYWEEASGEFDLTEGSAYHPLGLEYEITWQIVNSYGGTFAVETRERSDGRKYLYVAKNEEPDDEEQSWVDIRGEASDPYNPQEGEVIRITFERGKKRLDPTTYAQTLSVRQNTAQLPFDIKGNMSGIKTETANLPDDYNVILFLQVRARYFSTSEDNTGILSLPDGYNLPLHGETLSSGKINYNNHWGSSDGWHVAYRSDARCKRFEITGTNSTPESRTVKVNVNRFFGSYYRYIGFTNYFNFNNVNSFYTSTSVNILSSANLGIVDSIGKTVVFGAFKVMKASEVATMPDNLNIFQNYRVVSEQVQITAIHTKFSEVKSHHMFLSVGGNFAESDTYPSKVNESGTILSYLDWPAGVLGGSEAKKTILSYNDSTKPRYPDSYYVSNIGKTFSGLDSSYANVPTDSKEGIFPIPDAKITFSTICTNTTKNGSDISTMIGGSKVQSQSPIDGAANPTLNVGWYTPINTAYGTTGEGTFVSSNYGWVSSKDSETNLGFLGTIPDGTFVQQTALPLKGGSSTEYENENYGTKPNTQPGYYGTLGQVSKNLFYNVTGNASKQSYSYSSGGITYKKWEGEKQDFTDSATFSIPSMEPIVNLGYGNIIFYVNDEIYEGGTDTIDDIIYLENGTDPNEFNVDYSWD